MSFILEALKKSEQQRQQNETSPQKVRKRTISLQSQQSERRHLYLVLALILSLIIFGTWWLYDNAKATQEQPTAMERSMSTHEPTPQTAASKETREGTVAVSAPQQTTEEVPSKGDIPAQTVVKPEPSPVPSVYIEAPVPSRKKTPVERARPAPEVQRQEFAAAESLPLNKPVTTVNLEPSQEPSFGSLPHYQDLSAELRNRMPAISMSMHFYNKTPERRLVRINDLLLHEGDWIDRNLQLVEITGAGVTLDFLGKTFTLPRGRR